jgi:acetolactate synthase-1/2/3 large subunit
MEQQVVGWGDGTHWSHSDSCTVSRKLGEAFYKLGVRDIFGVLGGGIAPFAHGLMQNPFRFFHFRHEAGAGFAAVESYFASQRPALTVVTTGPGLFNVLNAMGAARADGAKLLLVSGSSQRELTGRGAVQETSTMTIPDPYIFQSGALFHFAARVETIQELQIALQRIQIGFQSPGGFVAHLSIPLNLQTQIIDPKISLIGQGWKIAQHQFSDSVIENCLDSLIHSRSVLWVGHGCRMASAELMQLATLTQTPVICSPRSKGVFNEHHPLFVGVSGAGGHESVPRFFNECSPETVFALGTRLGEVTSFFQPGLIPTNQWIHVDLDPSAFGIAYPAGVHGYGIQGECKQFLSQLLNAAIKREPLTKKEKPFWNSINSMIPPRLNPLEAHPVRPAFIMQTLQEEVLTQNQVTVMSEAGSAFTWCNHLLKFSNPNQYRTSAAWGSMGHFTTGVVGAALSGKKTAIAVVGDGSMLMNNEINTAVTYNARAIWLVMNDAQLGLNEHGMKALGMTPIETQMPRTDFVLFARSQGAKAKAVHNEHELKTALRWALDESGPVVLDIHSDPHSVSPILAARTKSLQNQQSKGGSL